MAIDPNWFRMPDVGGNALAAFHQARAEKKQEDAQKAFATFATNPEDPNALNALAQFDPKFVVERKQSMVSEKQKAMIEGAKVLGEAAMAADTPEKWDAAVDYLSQYYPKIAEYKGKFSPQLREATIASAGQMKAYIEQGKPVTVGPGAHLVDPATGKPKFSAPFAPRPVTLSPGQTAVEYDPNASAGDPAAIWKRMIHTESRGQHFTKNGQVITSPAGAIGIAQVMPGTAPEAARLAGVPFDEQRYRNDPAYNEQLGQAYFQEQLRTFGDPEKAVAAYNAGPGNVQKAVAKGGENWKQYLPGETKGYLQSVFGGGTRVIGRGDPKPPKENDPPSGYRWKQDGTLEPIPGGPATRPTQQNKPLPASQENKLANEYAIFSALDRASSGFKDDFAGNTITGGLENTLQAAFGTGTPGQRDWWADFRQTDNQVRNDLFGSALTATEKAAFEATTISERMAPAEIKRNLARRQKVLLGALQRRAKTMAAQGYNTDVISAVFGDDPRIMEAATAPAAPAGRPAPRPAAKPAAKKPTVSNW